MTEMKEEATMTAAPKATFETTIAAHGNNTGLVVPVEAIAQLGAGHRPPVHVDVNGYRYRSTVAVMGGKHMIGLSAAHRKASGLQGGDHVRVMLSLASAPREVEVPADFAEALASTPGLPAFFAGLSNSLQRYHVDNINGAKAADTRQRRIEKTVELFREGRKR